MTKDSQTALTAAEMYPGKYKPNCSACAGMGCDECAFPSTSNVPSATWKQIEHRPDKRARQLIEIIRIKCTRRFQGEDYQDEYKLGADATNHLREILAMVEEVQKLV